MISTPAARLIEHRHQARHGHGADWSWQNVQTGAQAGGVGFDQRRGHDHSTTTSGISAGTVTITDAAGQQARTGQSVTDTLAALHRDVHTGDSADGLTKQWDGQTLRNQVAAGADIVATVSLQAAQAVGHVADRHRWHSAPLTINPAAARET